MWVGHSSFQVKNESAMEGGREKDCTLSLSLPPSLPPSPSLSPLDRPTGNCRRSDGRAAGQARAQAAAARQDRPRGRNPSCLAVPFSASDPQGKGTAAFTPSAFDNWWAELQLPFSPSRDVALSLLVFLSFPANPRAQQLLGRLVGPGRQ